MPDALRLSGLRKSCNVLNFHDFVGRIRRSRRIRQEAIRKGRRSSPPFLFLQSAILKGDAGKYQAILSWVEEQGGIQVLLEKLQSGGLGAILSTWLSNQQGNQSVSGEQLESALGTNAVSDLGQKLGVDTSTASSLLAEQLPKIIDALSPQGEVSPQANNDLLSAGTELLKGKLFR